MGEICRAQGLVFHSDAAQAVGKLPLDVRSLHVDLLSFTAHKLYGPKGIGALYVRRASRPRIEAVSFGGGQERGLRPGTLPTHQIVGFAAACSLAATRRATEQARLTQLGDRLWNALRGLDGVYLNGEGAARCPDILNVSFEGVEGESLLTGLKELALSTGSACSSASGEPSYVLRALGRDAQLAQSSLRFSLGVGTTEADIDRAAVAVKRELAHLRGISPAARAEVFSAATANVLRGEAGSPAQDAWIRFHLLMAGDVVKDARFQAYGCPHTLAVTAWLTEQLPGRHRAELLQGEPVHLGASARCAGRETRPAAGSRRCIARLSSAWPEPRIRTA